MYNSFIRSKSDKQKKTNNLGGSRKIITRGKLVLGDSPSSSSVDYMGRGLIAPNQEKEKEEPQHVHDSIPLLPKNFVRSEVNRIESSESGAKDGSLNKRLAINVPSTHLSSVERLSDSIQDSLLSNICPSLESLPISRLSRVKTRLLDPPLLNPAVQNQIAQCLSNSVIDNGTLQKEEKISTFDSGIVRGIPVERTAGNPTDQNKTNTAFSDLEAAKLTTANAQVEQEALDDDSGASEQERKPKENKCFVFSQWSILLILVSLLACSLKIKYLRRISFLGLDLWRWKALALVVFCGHLISGWIVKLIVVLIEKHYLLKRRVLYFVYGLQNSVKNCIWLALVLAVWAVIFEGHEDSSVVSVMTKVLWCLVIASIAWMIKVLFVKVAASSFHRSAYFDRIQESLFNQYLLEKFSSPPILIPIVANDGIGKNGSKEQSSSGNHEGILSASTSSKRSEREIREVKGSSFNDGSLRMNEHEDSSVKENPLHTTIEFGSTSTPIPTITSAPTKKKKGTAFGVPIFLKTELPIEQGKLQNLTSETVSAWTLKRLMKIVRNTNMTTYSSLLSQERGESEIKSELQAKAAAKHIFQNMARSAQKNLSIEDFLRFLPEDMAAKAFSLFETTETGKVTKESFMNWVVGVFKERRALALTLNDNKTVVAKLHKVLNGVLFVTLVIISLLIFGVDTSKLLVFFTSIFIPSVFIFGNAARSTFESMIFLFITHPFDVGDRITVEGNSMLVEEMNVMNTVLLSVTNEKIYYPNSLLASKPISNFYRSPDQGDAIEFQIHMGTSVEKIAILKERMQQYIDSHPQHWYSEFRLLCTDIEDSNKMKMAIYMRHRLNFQEGGQRHERRSNMILYLKQQLEALGIGYQLPQQNIIVTGTPIHPF